MRLCNQIVFSTVDATMAFPLTRRSERLLTFIEDQLGNTCTVQYNNYLKSSFRFHSSYLRLIKKFNAHDDQLLYIHTVYF
jgi:hypothetical protein